MGTSHLEIAGANLANPELGVTKTSNRVTSNGATGKRVAAKNNHEGKFSRKRVTD